MKVLLIYPPIWQTTGWRTSCNNGIGLLSVGAVLRRDGNEVRILDTEVLGWDYPKIMEEIEKWKPTHIGISCLSNGLESACKLSKMIKETHPDVWVAMGGAGPSAESELALKESGADSVTIGEAELVLDKSFGEKGIHLGIIPEDLDVLPDPAYDLLEPKVGSPFWSGNLPVPDLNPVREIMVMWSRGCPHPCTFCSKASMKRGPTRTRSANRVVNELKYLKEKFGVNSIFVYDDELIGMGVKHNEWIISILSKISEEKIGLVLKGQGRCNKNFVTKEVCDALYNAGFFAMMMGCESGSELVKTHIRKHTSNDDIRHTLKMLHESGIKVFGFWMIGMPEETRDEAKKTEQLILEVSKYMTWIQVSVFSPLIGSVFWDEAIEHGWLKDFDKTKNFQVASMLDMPWMKGEEILRWQQKLYKAFQWAKENEGTNLAQ